VLFDLANVGAGLAEVAGGRSGGRLEEEEHDQKTPSRQSHASLVESL
jgi:hypothetical protein